MRESLALKIPSQFDIGLPITYKPVTYKKIVYSVIINFTVWMLYLLLLFNFVENVKLTDRD